MMEEYQVAKFKKIEFQWLLLTCAFLILIMKLPDLTIGLQIYQNLPHSGYVQRFFFDYFPRAVIFFIFLKFIIQIKKFSWLTALRFIGIKKVNLKQVFVCALLLLPVMISYYIFYQEGLKDGVDVFKKINSLKLLTLLFAVFFEELVFRGVIFQLLRPMRSFKQAAILSGLLWAVCHVDTLDMGVSDSQSIAKLIILLIKVFIFSFPLAYLFERCGNVIWGCVLVHFGVDMVLLLDTTEIHSIDKNHLFFKFILFGGFLLLVLLTFPLVNAFFPEVVEGEKFEIEKRPGKFMYFFDGNIFVKWFVYLLSFIVIFGYLVLVVICAPKPEEEKMKLCQRLTKIYPYDSDDHYFLSGAYLDLGRYEDVISESQKVIEIDPKYSDAYFRWGAALSRLGKNEEAVTKFEKATDLNPLDDVSYDYWGCALIGLRKYDDAIDKIQKALTINPKDDNAYNYWGFALEYLGKKAEAIQKFQKVLDISSNPDLINAANGEIVKLKGLKLFER